MVQNSAARLISRTKRRSHITPVLMNLHWLRVRERIEYKICILTFGFFTGECPSYFSSMLKKYTCNRSGHRSGSDNRKLQSFELDVNYAKYGKRSFSYCAPAIWNKLPFDLRHKDSMASFKAALKTYLFTRSYL